MVLVFILNITELWDKQEKGELKIAKYEDMVGHKVENKGLEHLMVFVRACYGRREWDKCHRKQPISQFVKISTEAAALIHLENAWDVWNDYAIQYDEWKKKESEGKGNGMGFLYHRKVNYKHSVEVNQQDGLNLKGGNGWPEKSRVAFTNWCKYVAKN